LSSDIVSKDWHHLLQDDRIWQALCKVHKMKGQASGYAMMALIKSRPECRLSWRQLFVQRARSLKEPRLDDDGAEALPQREDFLIGAEVYLMEVPEQTYGDVEDDQAVLTALRERLAAAYEDEVGCYIDEDEPRRLPSRKARKDPQKVLDDTERLRESLDKKSDIISTAIPHLHGLFGPAVLARKEWIFRQALHGDRRWSAGNRPRN
jgi:hypothetical protein